MCNLDMDYVDMTSIKYNSYYFILPAAAVTDDKQICHEFAKGAHSWKKKVGCKTLQWYREFNLNKSYANSFAPSIPGLANQWPAR